MSVSYLKPAVIALAFGVLFALFVTLFLVPSLYCIGDDVQALLRKARENVRGLIPGKSPGLSSELVAVEQPE